MADKIRVKARGRMIGLSVPDDAQPGDLVVGNRGAAAEVQEIWTSSGLSSCLVLKYVGNYYEGARPSVGCRMHDRR